MTTPAAYVGIDISKESFDVAFPQRDNTYEIKTFTNDLKGWEKLDKELGSGDISVVEATGSYHVGLAVFLSNCGRKICVVNPLQVKYFARMKMSRAKTDKADAILIACYGQFENPPGWTPRADHLVELQQLLSVSAQLTNQKTALQNQLKSLKLVPNYSEVAIGVLEEQISNLKVQLLNLQTQINQIVRSNYPQMESSLRSIPGIGPKTCAVLLLVTEGFTKFDNYKALIAYAGLAPRTYQSGATVKGPAHICKLGAVYLRKLLYECAHSAKRFNPTCKKLFNRLYLEKKKHFRVAMIAVANKLIKLAFAIVASGKTYDPKYESVKTV